MSYWSLENNVLFFFKGRQEPASTCSRMLSGTSCWQVGRNSKKAKKNLRFFEVFWSPGLPTSNQIWQKSVPRPIKIQAKNWSASWSVFWWILAPTWVDFGRLLAAKLEPCWHQMPSKPDPKTNQKNDCFLEGLRIDFGWIWAPKLAPYGSHFCSLFGHFFDLGAILGLRGSQDPPKSRQDRFLIDFWLIFDGFLIDFKSISRFLF